MKVWDKQRTFSFFNFEAELGEEWALDFLPRPAFPFVSGIAGVVAVGADFRLLLPVLTSSCLVRSIFVRAANSSATSF